MVTPLYCAEIVATVVVATDDVVIVKYEDDIAPAATGTEAGTPTPETLLVKVTLMPPAGAGPFKFTLFNVVETPPFTVVTERPTEIGATGLTVRIAVLFTPLKVAVIVIDAVTDTAEVVIVNAADAVAPAGTITDAGTPTPGSLLLRLTLTPPAGAGPFRFTLFKVAETPPTTVVGDNTTESNATGLSVRMAVLVTPLYIAEIVTDTVAETAEVVIVNAGDAVAPAATVTETGTPTPELLLVRLTMTPPAGAGPVRFTLFNVVGTPPTVEVGDSATESNATGLTVRMAVLVTPLYTAEIVTDTVAGTTEVVIVNAGDAVAPAATVTETGTPTPELLLVRLTVTPPAGAGPVRFTLFNVVGTPPTTVVGDNATESSASGFTVRIAVLVTLLYVGEIVTMDVV